MAVKTRLVRVGIGDSLRTIAMRELGSALRWIELAELNELKPPYIIESIRPDDRLRGTLIFGDSIRIPLGRVEKAPQSAEDVFGIDVQLVSGDIPVTAGGDYALVSGVENLRQALIHRIKTSLGELITHPDYGCNANVAIGLKVMPVTLIMLAGYVRRAILAEPRVQTLNSLSPRAEGDVIVIGANITPVSDNTPVDMNLVFPVVR